MGCRIGGVGDMDSGPVRNGSSPDGNLPVRALLCEKYLGRTPPASGGHQLPGGDSGSATCPVDVHLAQITEGVLGWG